MPLQALDETLDYEARALRAEQKAEVAETRHLTALWLELATTYRELGEYHRGQTYEASRLGRNPTTGEAIQAASRCR
jgi:hypothetical protein